MVLSSFLITLREGVEAALIVGVILGYLKKVGAKSLERPFFIGIGFGAAASVAVAAIFSLLAVEFEGNLETLFEGVTMVISMVVLTTVILWMNENSKAYSEGLKRKVDEALAGTKTLAFASLAFISIFREGVETVLFLGSTSFTSSGAQTLLGGLLGLGASVAFAIAIIKYSARLDLKMFFNITGFLLIMFAAGLTARAVFEFQEAGYIAPIVDHVWNINWLVDDQGRLGMILTALFGYDGSPSLSEVLGYVLYWVAVAILIYRDAVRKLVMRAFGYPRSA